MNAIMPWHVVVLALGVLFVVIVVGGLFVVRALVRSEQRERPPGPYSSGPQPPAA